MKELETSFICSICHKNNINIKKYKTKKNKLFDDLIKDIELDDLIQKCHCNNKNNINSILKKSDNNIYTHKYCLLLKILFNFEIKCEICNTIYNIKIQKKIDKNKRIYLFISFLIIYILHLLIYLFCMFLIFINVLLKGYLLISYKHICPFFGVIFFILNTFFLYFSIIKNIEKCKIYIYKYSINIFDVIKRNNKDNNINNENELLKLMYEFYQWFYKQSIKNLLINKHKNFIINKDNYIYNNERRKYIKNNNKKDLYVDENYIKNKLESQIQESKNNDNTKDYIIRINNDNDRNDLNINKYLTLKNNKNIEKVDNIYSNRSYNSKDKLNIIQEDKNININNNSQKKSNNNNSLNSKDEHLKLEHKDFINININPTASKNININIHITSDRNSLIDFSSSKEVTLKSVARKRKLLKTVLIPKNLIISKLVSEANSFKRKNRQLKSIKLNQNKLKLKELKTDGNTELDEEIDFSEFEKNDSKTSKVSTENKKNNLIKNDSENKYENFKRKKSYNELALNISNSDMGGIEENSNKQEFRLSLKNNMVGKHVHFLDAK